jgi:hypothetical protein
MVGCGLTLQAQLQGQLGQDTRRLKRDLDGRHERPDAGTYPAAAPVQSAGAAELDLTKLNVEPNAFAVRDY